VGPGGLPAPKGRRGTFRARSCIAPPLSPRSSAFSQGTFSLRGIG